MKILYYMFLISLSNQGEPQLLNEQAQQPQEPLPQRHPQPHHPHPQFKTLVKFN